MAALDLFVRILRKNLNVELEETSYDFLKKGADEYLQGKNKLKTNFDWNDEHDLKFDAF